MFLGAPSPPTSSIVEMLRQPKSASLKGQFGDHLDFSLAMYREMGMTDLELRDVMRAKVRQLNEAQEDAA